MAPLSGRVRTALLLAVLILAPIVAVQTAADMLGRLPCPAPPDHVHRDVHRAPSFDPGPPGRHAPRHRPPRGPRR